MSDNRGRITYDVIKALILRRDVRVVDGALKAASSVESTVGLRSGFGHVVVGLSRSVAQRIVR